MEYISGCLSGEGMTTRANFCGWCTVDLVSSDLVKCNQEKLGNSRRRLFIFVFAEPSLMSLRLPTSYRVYSL